MYPHRIRLRGPWVCEPLARAHNGEPLPTSFQVTMPCRWSDSRLGDFAGTVRFRRRFGFPGRLDPHEHVWLTFAGLTGVAEFHLNNRPVGHWAGETGSVEFEITDILQPRNELVVEITAAGDGGFWGEVALEVRCPAFLRVVRLWLEETSPGQRLHATGEIGGSASRLLELYVVADGTTVAYGTHPAGHPFHVTADLPPAESVRQVRLELVDGGSLWYALEQPLPAVPPG